MAARNAVCMCTNLVMNALIVHIAKKMVKRVVQVDSMNKVESRRRYVLPCFCLVLIIALLL